MLSLSLIALAGWLVWDQGPLFLHTANICTTLFPIEKAAKIIYIFTCFNIFEDKIEVVFLLLRTKVVCWKMILNKYVE